ncbi:DUF4328 domain-containing protein [Actinophytocola glycyrrhizae]|uniref:DUF4328 domain-containing protein n=1 Tax=Actinophytocola glycyrrhizae TaxID=2044873 RepID=A0ABV9S2P6_9PSEU
MTQPRQRWTATVPPGTGRRPRPRRRLPYLGPPGYRTPPRWGFPALAWRWPTTVPGTLPDQPVTVDRVRAVAGHASAMMWALACLALITAGGEIWRYVLLLESRTGALSARLVSTSDAVVTIAGVLTLAFTVLAAIVALWWLHLARHAAADLAHQQVTRPDWQVLVYLLVPGVNLAMAGVILTELEHQVLHRPATTRPRPTKPVAIWWATWAAAGVLFATTVAWRFRDSVQAHADSIVLSALTDLSAAGVAVLTALLIRRLTTLLAPINPTTVRYLRVIQIKNAPTPPLRQTRPTPSRR